MSDGIQIEKQQGKTREQKRRKGWKKKVKRRNTNMNNEIVRENRGIENYAKKGKKSKGMKCK